ncbi:hypothetical protein HDU67_007767 [Dinochytrium kinnereticum]|nr:hypothetical protein HDU67_007767 [Dinochytrium kinnereticum]
MTRVTKMKRKTHLEASEGWNVTALIPKSKLSDQTPSHPPPTTTPTPTPTPPTPPSEPAHPADQKRKRGDEEAGEAPAAADGGGEEKAGKKKRIRHKSKNDVVPAASAVGGKGKVGGGGGEAENAMDREERQAQRRRARRLREKERTTICFLCRKKGHSIKNCDKAPGAGAAPKDEAEVDEGMGEGMIEGICYRCGSGEHKSSQCKKKVHPDTPYPFATCFVCKKQGHLSGFCEQNERGLYPNGGSCRFCNSVRHLAKDCRPSRPGEAVTELGLIDAEQGGDDDDVFLALMRMEEEKEGKKKASLAAGARVGGRAAALGGAKVGVKKIVKF